jgi:hypothetical protein
MAITAAEKLLIAGGVLNLAYPGQPRAHRHDRTPPATPITRICA